MNDDRCQHMPTSPGQSVCSCMDVIMTLRFWASVQAQIIADLSAQVERERGNTGPARVVRLASGKWKAVTPPPPPDPAAPICREGGCYGAAMLDGGSCWYCPSCGSTQGTH